MSRTAALLITMVASGTSGLVAQGRPLSPQGQQNLQFGQVIRGIRSSVSRLDAANVGVFAVRGARLTQVRLELTLPPAMLSTTGVQLPLEFGASDGGVSPEGTIASSTAFDPRVPLLARLSQQGRVYIFLGGSVLPAQTQPATIYTATIVLTASYTGN